MQVKIQIIYDNEKTVLVTGASLGFGLLIANELRSKSYNVIGTTRKGTSVLINMQRLACSILKKCS